jgi:tartrate dehydratase beta subunit/fumarate hydratase class I family protein
VSSAGLLTFNMIDAVYITPTGFDMSRIALISVVMQREVLGSAGSTTSASFNSFTYASVPGPGSIALLGAAGLIGARRRRV